MPICAVHIMFYTIPFPLCNEKNQKKSIYAAHELVGNFHVDKKYIVKMHI